MKIIRQRNGKESPAIGLCNACNQPVLLTTSTNVCPCGCMYNSAGQELAPVRFWGEETGEHPSDIWNSDEVNQ